MAAPVHPKMKAVGLVGAVVFLVVTALGAYGIDVPPDVSAAAVLVLSWLAGYFKVGPVA